MHKRCTKCNIRITTHLCVINEVVYCSLGCYRGKDSVFAKTFSALKRMSKGDKEGLL